MKRLFTALVALMICLTALAAPANAAIMPEVIVNDEFYFCFTVPDKWSGNYTVKAARDVTPEIQYALTFNSKTADAPTLLELHITSRDNGFKQSEQLGSIFAYNERYDYYVKLGGKTGDWLLDSLIAAIDNLEAYLTVLPAPLSGYYTNKKYDFSIKLPTIWDNPRQIAFVDTELEGEVSHATQIKYHPPLAPDSEWYTICTIYALDYQHLPFNMTSGKYDQYIGRNRDYMFYLSESRNKDIPKNVKAPATNLSEAFLGHYLAPPIGVAILANNQPINANAEKKGGEAFLPLRPICEAFGYKLQWDDRSKRIKITGNNKTITTAIGDNEIYINDSKIPKTLTTPPYTSNVTTYIVTDFFEQILELDVYDTVDGEHIVEKTL